MDTHTYRCVHLSTKYPSMTPREWVEEQLVDDNPDALFMDGLDSAIIGITVSLHAASGLSVVVYDEDLIIKRATDE